MGQARRFQFGMAQVELLKWPKYGALKLNSLHTSRVRLIITYVYQVNGPS